MLERLKSLWRVTAVRLSVAYTLAFGLMAVFLVLYMTGGAVDYLRQQYQETINEEVASLEKIYRERGLNSVIRTMEARATAPGANLYVISDPNGQILAGNVRTIETGVLRSEGWVLHPFEYQPFQMENDERNHRAVARAFILPNGMRILIGRDIGEPERFRDVVRRALTLSMLMMLAVGFLIWFFVGRRALKRIDSVSRSTERILAGDHSERLPVMGSNDEFDRLSRRMNAMLDRITVLDSGLKSVSDSIAHDLKTPLTRIRNKADGVLRADADDTEQVVALGEIIEEADQLIKVFNALLMISRVEAGSQVAELTPIDISALIADIAELYEPLAEEEGFAFTVKTESDLMVQGNRELLSQAVSNLIDNAFKYADGGEQNGKQIELRLYREKASVVVAVSDKGPGIPPQDYERAKERFSRLDESRTKPGSGLGLALVDAIAKFHSGQLEMSDAEPGLLVCIVLPALEK
jgi:signal transduction histidine kinase